MFTVEPSTVTLFRAAWTSELLQVAAWMVWACAAVPKRPIKKNANKSDFTTLVIGMVPFERDCTMGLSSTYDIAQ
jgi:hypothetical protein